MSRRKSEPEPRFEEVRDKRRFVVNRPKEPDRGPQDTPANRNYREALESGTKAGIETAQRLRQELGIQISDHELESRVRARKVEATRKVMRENGDG
jgi:hypothetical protein